MDWKSIKLWFLSKKALIEEIAYLQEQVAYLEDVNESINRELQAAKLNSKKKAAKKKSK